MSIDSMTGFARDEAEHGDFSWRWEVRSVNHRGLDVRVRMPPGMESFEVRVRELVGKRFRRGSFSISLNITATPGLVGYRLNEALLDRLLEIAEAVRVRVGGASPQVDGLLRLRGVLEPEEPGTDDASRSARETAMAESLEAALEKVALTRRQEGERLKLVLVELIGEISGLTTAARGLAAAQPQAIRARVAAQFDELLQGLAPLSDERLAQETALLVAKADVREEIDRLDSHASQAREVIEAGGATGRRLDFLAQEFNREANTLCSKAQDLELTRIGLDLKAAIEQFREQVQNIE